MTDDPNKRQNDATQSGQSSQQQGQQSGQQQRSTDTISQKRPGQSGTDAELDREDQDQGGQRRAS